MNLGTPQPVAPEPIPLMSAGPACENCGQPALAQWQRRLTDAELAVELAAERTRREEAYLLRNVQLPDPDFGPMPTGADYVRAVFACGNHAIDIEAAASIHEATCTGPHGDHTPHPKCTCTPEPLPAADTGPLDPGSPAHWR
jgi:hypothetical protein